MFTIKIDPSKLLPL